VNFGTLGLSAGGDLWILLIEPLAHSRRALLEYRRVLWLGVDHRRSHKSRFVGCEKLDFQFVLTFAAYNLIRMRNLGVAGYC
jgi:hypothetical protein